MEIVENRGAEILLPIIQSVLRPGSIVHSHEWRSYRQIQGRTGLSHRTVNHSINFVEPITGVHTQNIESYWNVKKTLIKKCEVASKNYCTGTFKNICGEIVLIEITMFLILLLGISIYSTNFELFAAVSVWGGDCSLGQFGGGGGGRFFTWSDASDASATADIICRRKSFQKLFQNSSWIY